MTDNKCPLSEKDIEFLTNLKNEMISQEGTTGNAEPVYFSLIETEGIPTDEDFSDELCIYEKNTGETITTGMESAVNDVLSYLGESGDIENLEKEGWKITAKNNQITACFNDKKKNITITQYNDSLYDILDVINEIWEKAGIAITVSMDIMPIYNVHKIVENTLFITKKAADKYLERFRYNHKKGTHSYAMTAIRSPEIEKLWEIIKTTDWEAFR